MALVLTGIAHWKTLNNDSPVADALKALGHEPAFADGSTSGALVGMISSLLVFQYGQARIWFAMSRDGLLPKAFREGAPQFPDAACQHVDRGLVVGIPAGIWDIDTFAELSNIGTLFAFIVVSAGVMVLRKNAAGAAAQLPRAVVPAGADACRSCAAWC